MIKLEIDKLKIEDATHVLHCRYCIGRSAYNYTMKCLILGKTKSGKYKILVFGERYWKRYKNKKRIRYIDESQISEIKSNK
jgi:hypothetical protein